MARVKYSGGFRPGVNVTHEDGRVEEVQYLGEIEVSAKTRDSLLAQDSDAWTEIKSTPSTDKKGS